MDITQALVALLIFPGLLYAVPMAWLMLWIERKLLARMQGRIGPPFYQPFFDFIKLLAKHPLRRSGLEGLLLAALPTLAVGGLLGALALLPVRPNVSGLAGDLILLVALLEIPALAMILAGFASRSLFGQVGATREAVLSLTYNLPFLTALLALATLASSLRLTDLAAWPATSTLWAGENLGRWLALLALILCLPVRLRLNPFSLANAEQEIYAGPLTEFGGPHLALWELAHGLERVVLTGLVVSLAGPGFTGVWPVDLLVLGGLSLVLLIFLTTLAAATARLKILQATHFYWRWGLGLAVLALLLAAWPTWGG